MTLPDASPAAVALFVHIAGGAVGIVSGFAALAVKKGSPLHRGAGKAFVLAMLVMVVFAAVLAAGRVQWGNLMAAALTGYLVVTGWAAVRRRPGASGGFEVAALLAAVAVAAACFVLAVQDVPAFGPDGSGSGFRAGYYAFGTVAALAALMDLRVVRRGGLSGADRTSRHLWRMCLALFVAAGSFFLGQADEFPSEWRGPHLFAPPLLALAAMAFWLVRVRLRPRKPVPAAA